MRIAYGLLNVVVLALHILVPVAGLVAVAVKVKDRPRALGIAGCAVLAAAAVLQTIWIYAAPQLFRVLGGASSIPTTYAIVNAVFTIVSALGLALVIAAVIAGRPAPGPTAFVPQPPNPYQQPPR